MWRIALFEAAKLRREGGERISVGVAVIVPTILGAPYGPPYKDKTRVFSFEGKLEVLIENRIKSIGLHHVRVRRR